MVAQVIACRVLWRDPIEGSAGDVHLGLRFHSSSMFATRFLLLSEGEEGGEEGGEPPWPYARSDFELLGQSEREVYEAAGFVCRGKA